MKPMLGSISNDRLRENVIIQIEWDPETPHDKIGVVAESGVVTLTGFVDTYANKLAAEKAAKRAYGVRAIANDIKVKPTNTRTDTEIAKNVIDALSIRVNIPDKDITVTVKDGWVTLEGYVQWMFQKDAAESAVKYLFDVKGINNLIKIQQTTSAKQIKSKIEEVFKHNAEIDAKHILVAEHGGKVTLTGKVKFWSEIEEAKRAAWGVPGVTEVESHLTL